MNTVLKKLHDEAVIYTVSLCGQEHVLGPRPFQEVLDEKFAELIVRECISLTNECSGKVHPDDLTQMFSEHFGVEK